MTIHNLSPNANILFASDSIYDILGYQPDEVQGKSCFDYFHPDEVPFARSIHNRGVLLDKAAVLQYARIFSKDGRWVSCECCFTVVHDVLVACTSIYLRGEKSERRALEAPQIRRLFSCSPRDPRYHMLEHLSPKFRMPPVEREPRAALILNRFTRNLSIMFATNAVTTILGMRPDEIKEKSFYACIQENCLPDAMRCLESAKANESIAYLRFWFRDPRDPEEVDEDDDDDDDDNDMGGSNRDSESIDSESGGVPLNEDTDMDGEFPFDNHGRRIKAPGAHESAARPSRTPERNRNRQGEPEPLELEAVVSCTSDGLVVVLRKARPPIPAPTPQPLLSQAVSAAPVAPAAPVLNYQNGLFAAPWGQNPIQPYVPAEQLYTFRPPLLPQYMPLRESVKAAGGPPVDQLMRSIRDVAVFAWALVGINGNLAHYGRGVPRDKAQPDALPIWAPDAGDTGYQPPENRAAQRWSTRDKGKGVDGRDTNYVRSDRSAPYPPRKPAQQLPPPRATFAPMQQPPTQAWKTTLMAAVRVLSAGHNPPHSTVRMLTNSRPMNGQAMSNKAMNGRLMNSRAITGIKIHGQTGRQSCLLSARTVTTAISSHIVLIILLRRHLYCTRKHPHNQSRDPLVARARIPQRPDSTIQKQVQRRRKLMLILDCHRPISRQPRCPPLKT